MNAHSALPVDRRSERTHLFLVATLSFGRASMPVRVRNLSASGALVESTHLPPRGTAIYLRRGALEAVGSVVWEGAGKAGLSFSEPVAVSVWLPTKETKRQTQVDQIAFEVNQAERVFSGKAAPEVDDATMSKTAVVAELAGLRADLDRLGDKLAHDEFLLASHPEVQCLNAAGQRIGKIIAALSSASPH